MRHSAISYPFPLAAALATIACSPTVPCSLDSEARSAIEAIEQEHIKHVRAGNLEAIAPTYAHDATMMPPNQPEIRGRDAIRASLRQLPPVAKYELTFDAVEGCGDLAIVKGQYALTVALADTLAPIEDSGRFLHVFRREGGEWLIAYDIFSSDRPLP